MSETIVEDPASPGLRGRSTADDRGRPRHAHAATPRPPGGLSAYLAWAVAGLVILSGIAVRCWYLFHRPVNGDEAIAGLLANQIAHGHFSAFYWGQSYGGAEPYLVAVLFRVFGSGIWAMKVVPVLLAAVAGVLTWRVVRRLVPDPSLAVLAGALVWASPLTALSNSTLELGFRGVTLVCSLGILLSALRILDGRRRPVEFAVLGLVAGIGWWSSPELVYFALPSGLLLAWAIIRDADQGRARRWTGRLAVVLGAVIVGSSPWLWANAHSSFRSLRSSSFNLPPGSPGYGGRLHLFFKYSVPMLFNLRAQSSGAYLWGRMNSLIVLAVLVLILAVALVLCLLRDVKGRIIAVAVLAFPLLLALSPATWYWGDGRYADFIGPLLAMTLAIGCSEAGRRLAGRRADESGNSGRAAAVGRVALAVVVTGIVAVGIVDFSRTVTPVSSYAANWRDPNGPAMHAVDVLEANGVRYGYADYWVAYPLTLLSDGRLRITTAGNDPDRWSALDAQVQASSSPAWLFVTPDAAAINQFGSTFAIQGPNGEPQAQFVAELHHLGIPYRVVDAGLVTAVIPDRPVPPSTVGLGRPPG